MALSPETSSLHNSTNNLLCLPGEIILSIGDQITKESDLNHFAQTCCHLYYTFNKKLYKRNALNKERPALIWAVENHRMRSARKALELGADVDFPKPYFSGTEDFTAGYTPLQLAVEKRHVNMVPLLLSYGADVKRVLPGHISSTALNIAIRYRLSDTVKTLLENGALVDGNGFTIRTPLHEALCLGGKAGSAIVRTLIQHGANIDPNDQRGIRARILAEKVYDKDIRALILEEPGSIVARHEAGLAKRKGKAGSTDKKNKGKNTSDSLDKDSPNSKTLSNTSTPEIKHTECSWEEMCKNAKTTAQQTKDKNEGKSKKKGYRPKRK